MRFEIDWASVIAGSKFTRFALFSFVFKGNFPSTSLPLPRGGGGAYIWRGDLTEGFLRLILEGLIFGILRYKPSERRYAKQNESEHGD